MPEQENSHSHGVSSCVQSEGASRCIDTDVDYGVLGAIERERVSLCASSSPFELIRVCAPLCLCKIMAQLDDKPVVQRDPGFWRQSRNRNRRRGRASKRSSKDV